MPTPQKPVKKAIILKTRVNVIFLCPQLVKN